MLVYHVTPVCNLKAIRESGIRPELSHGKRQASWWVCRDRVVWAIAHVGFRQGVKSERLVVVEKRSDLLNLTQYQTGIFYCADVVPELPGRIFQAASILMLDHKGRWLCTHEEVIQVQTDDVAVATGIDWDAIRVALNTPDDYDGNDERWRCVGDLQELLPSRRFYDITALGVDVDLATVAQDAAWLRLARQEAEARGWKLHTEEFSQTVWVSAAVVVV